MRINLVGPTYKQPFPEANPEECINWYPVLDTAGGEQVTLFPTSGRVSVANVSSIYGGQILGNDGTNFYYYNNNTLYKLAPTAGSYTGNLTVTNLGTTAFTNPQNRMTSQTNQSSQLFFSNGDANIGYVYNWNTNTLAKIATSNFVGAKTSAYIDGYIFYSAGNTNQMYASPIDDAVNWTSTSTTTVNARAGNIIALHAIKRDLYVFCARDIELWTDSGSSPFPFTRRSDISFDFGCGAAFSVAEVSNCPYWLDNFGDVRYIHNYQIYLASTPAFSYEIRTYSTISDAYAFTYVEGNQSFYEITFPTAGVTWVYSHEAQMWHKRLSWNTGLSTYQQNLSTSTVYIGNQLFVADPFNGNVYRLSPTTYTDNGSVIRRTRISTTDHDEFNRISYDQLELRMTSGASIASGQGSNAQIMLQVSKDGGHTYGNELWRSIGQIGQYLTRVIWRRLGYARRWTFKLHVTDPVPVVLAYASACLSGGDSKKGDQYGGIT